MLSQVIRLTADATAFQRGVAHSAKHTQQAFKAVTDELSRKLTGMFTAGALLGGAMSLFHTIRDTADEIKDLADQLELSTDEVQKLQVAADKVGVRFNVVAAAVRTIEDLRAAAATGDKRAVGIFGALGIDPSKGTSLDILTKAVEASETAGRGSKEQAALFDLVGKKANILRNIVFELNKLGGIKIIDQDALDAVDEANNQLKDLKRELVATAAEPLGFWARVLQRGRAIEDQGGAFALTRAILGETFGGTTGGVDLSALPLPMRKPKGGETPEIPTATTTTPPTASAIPLATQGDALSRIGLFVGGAGMTGTEQLVTIGNYQLSELRRIRATLEHANQ